MKKKQDKTPDKVLVDVATLKWMQDQWHELAKFLREIAERDMDGDLPTLDGKTLYRMGSLTRAYEVCSRYAMSRIDVHHVKATDLTPKAMEAMEAKAGQRVTP